MDVRDVVLPVSREAVDQLEILDTQPEAAFDELAQRAARELKTTMAAISFFDRPANPALPWREWFKSSIGFPARALSRAESFFLPALDDGLPPARVFAVPDLFAEKRFRDHRLVHGAPHIACYAGAALLNAAREIVGVVAVFDTVSRDFSGRELEALVRLADQVAERLEARAIARQERRPAQSEYADFTEPAADQLDRLSREVARLEQMLENEIAGRKAIESKLSKEKEFASAAMQSLPGAFFMFDVYGRLVRWNKSFAATTGYSEDDVAGMRAIDFVAEDDRPRVAEAIRRVLVEGEETSIEARMRRRDGSGAPYLFEGRPMDIAGMRYCVGVGRDISERLRADREVRRAKERLDLALTGSNLAIWDWDLVANEVTFSQDWARLLRAQVTDRQDIVFSGVEVIDWNHPDDRERLMQALTATIKGDTPDFVCEYRVHGIDEEWVWIESKGKVVETDPATGHAMRMTGTSANITMKKAAEDRVEFLATRDPLTKLPNRMLLNDRLERGVANAARKQSRLAFMFIDLDRFKSINDTLGHDVGDELLRKVAARLSACVRNADTVARLGGDEFAVILENLPADEDAGAEGAQHVAEKMISALAAPILINDQPLNTSCSIGISIFPHDGHDTQTLMKHADVAMYDAKAKGRNNFQFFSQEMNARAQERLSVERFLRLAVRNRELELHYQPRVSFLTGQITGVEALMRWNHPRRGLLTPDKFIHVAEDSGQITAMGEWVFEHAFRQVADWRARSGRDLGLAVNLSPAQLFDGERLMRAIEGALTSSGLEPAAVEIELTEGMLVKNVEETRALLDRIGALGPGIAIDDFGTGYSSLSYLRQLPVDTIKIDSQFVREIGMNPNDEAIIRAIIAMTHSLKLNVVAEGVENEAQYRVLRDLECDEYQGFFFARPLPATEFEAQYLDLK
ncbi:MAG: EAL domain-containing protein [Betaproteobacteria bacterium]|nr:EAL domain-containing protein [Betaproteobacteria bacterium]